MKTKSAAVLPKIVSDDGWRKAHAKLLAQEKASEVLAAAQERIQPVYTAFAEKHNVRLVDGGESRLDKRMRQVGLVNAYYNQVFLIFFKSYKQEAYVMEALNRKDVNGLEQNRGTLIRYADEGLRRLDTLEGFKGDGSLATACRKVLEFHKREGESQLPGVNDYLMKSDEFEKIKKAFDAKPANRRTQDDIDAYNQAVEDINAAVNSSNQMLTAINNGRENVLNNWNVTRKRFMELHVPKGR